MITETPTPSLSTTTFGSRTPSLNPSKHELDVAGKFDSDGHWRHSALNQSLSSFSFSSRPTTPRKQIEEVDPGTSVPLDLDLINTRLSRTATWQAELQSGEEHAFERRTTLTRIVSPIVAPIQEASQNVAAAVRRSSLYDVYEKAKVRGAHLQRKQWVQISFECSVYFVLLAFIYFVLVGRPLWNGAVWWLYWVVENRFVIEGGFAITLGLATMYLSPLSGLSGTEC